MDYSKLDLSALRAYARKQGVGVTTGMSRDQLIKAIKNKSISSVGKLKDQSGTSKVLKEKSSTSTRLVDKSSNVPTPRKRPADTKKSTQSNNKKESGTPLRVKVGEGYSPSKSAQQLKRLTQEARGSSGKLKNNMSMDKDKMANSIAAARKRNEGYYFDKKSGKKQLAIYKNDLNEGESLRSAANRLMGLKRGK